MFYYLVTCRVLNLYKQPSNILTARPAAVNDELPQFIPCSRCRCFLSDLEVHLLCASFLQQCGSEEEYKPSKRTHSHVKNIALIQNDKYRRTPGQFYVCKVVVFYGIPLQIKLPCQSPLSPMKTCSQEFIYRAVRL